MKRICYILLVTLTWSATVKAGISINKTVIHQQKPKRPKVAMSDAEAKAILAKMQQKNNDDEKAEVLKAGVKDKGITVEQLTPLLNQFGADEGKLICAKFAYPYTVNYKAYQKISDLFGDEQSKRELEDFVSKNR